MILTNSKLLMPIKSPMLTSSSKSKSIKSLSISRKNTRIYEQLVHRMVVRHLQWVDTYSIVFSTNFTYITMSRLSPLKITSAPSRKDPRQCCIRQHQLFMFRFYAFKCDYTKEKDKFLNMISEVWNQIFSHHLSSLTYRNKIQITKIPN